ncbi:MAG: hypothetical protein BWY40_01184 [bacterium ADurb.Bin270]|jgi:hypothetical protein|nr:MAG: hypothetical protein BWY40_01184 [bacterium ADurb.Bin270]
MTAPQTKNNCIFGAFRGAAAVIAAFIKRCSLLNVGVNYSHHKSTAVPSMTAPKRAANPTTGAISYPIRPFLSNDNFSPSFDGRASEIKQLTGKSKRNKRR